MLESYCLSVDNYTWKCDGDIQRDAKYRTAALGLWEGLSHSASLRLIVIVLKFHSALLHSIVIVLKCHSALLHLVVIGLKVVAAKTNDSNYSGLQLKCSWRSPGT